MNKNFIIIVVLFVFGLSGVSGADQPPPGKLKNSVRFTLYDNNSKAMGNVITISRFVDGFSNAPSFPGTLRNVLIRLILLDSNGEEHPVGFIVDQFSINFQNRVLFDGIDCTGIPYIRDVIAETGFPDAFEASAIVTDNTDPNVRNIYVPADEAFTSREMKSVLIGDTCSPVSITVDTVHALKLKGNSSSYDLHEVFPPGYTLSVH